MSESAPSLPEPSDVEQVSVATGVSFGGLKAFGKQLSEAYQAVASHIGSSSDKQNSPAPQA
jgi:hypothetical protein